MDPSTFMICNQCSRDSFHDWKVRAAEFLHKEIAYRVDVCCRVVLLWIAGYFLGLKGSVNGCLSIIFLNNLKNFTKHISLASAYKDFEISYCFLHVGTVALIEGLKDPIFFQQYNDVEYKPFIKGIITWVVFRPYHDMNISILY